MSDDDLIGMARRYYQSLLTEKQEELLLSKVRDSHDESKVDRLNAQNDLRGAVEGGSTKYIRITSSKIVMIDANTGRVTVENLIDAKESEQKQKAPGGEPDRKLDLD